MSIHLALDDRIRLVLEASFEMAASFTSGDPMPPPLREQVWDDLESELARCRLTLGEALRLYRQEREAARRLRHHPSPTDGVGLAAGPIAQGEPH